MKELVILLRPKGKMSKRSSNYFAQKRLRAAISDTNYVYNTDSAHNIRHKLAKIKMDDGDYMMQKLSKRIVTNLADTTKVATGVVIGLQLAMHDACEGLPSMITTILQLYVPDFIRAVMRTPKEAAIVNYHFSVLMIKMKNNNAERSDSRKAV